jgi:Raf kinase inhibitor-like YbhB/YbcL family protein
MAFQGAPLRLALIALTLWNGTAARARAADHPDLFRLTSPDLADNGMLSARSAGSGTSPRGPWACGGEDQSPALAWSHAPAGTKSFAIIMDDPDAASGRGGAHWIIYDIPPDVPSLRRGAANRGGNFVAGNPGRGKAYSGPCAEPGAKAHHFIFMVYALDLAPGVLTPGLSRSDFARAIAGHNLAEASLVARYQRAPDGKPLTRPR